MIQIKKTSNTRSLETDHFTLTFWKRASASCGRTEAWRHSDGLWASVTAWGWMVSLEVPLAHREGGPDPWQSYHRSLWAIDLPWLAYDQWRGGALTHFAWGRRIAQWRDERREARRVYALQHRKNWWEARGGQWWEFDEDETRSYYKFCRAVYGMTASEAWDHTKVRMGRLNEQRAELEEAQ